MSVCEWGGTYIYIHTRCRKLQIEVLDSIGSICRDPVFVLIKDDLQLKYIHPPDLRDILKTVSSRLGDVCM